MNTERFAYAQARIQARHGMRPQEAVWRRLASSGDLVSFLQAARGTPLRPWIDGIQSAPGSHAIELHLRRQFRGYVEDVARWLPANWRAPVLWIRYLPDLPALQQLLKDETVPAWLREDPDLGKFVGGDHAGSAGLLRSTELACLADANSQNIPLYLAWFEHWRRLWPGGQSVHAGLLALARIIQNHIHAELKAPLSSDSDHREWLAAGLNSVFRRYSFEPAAACAHLGLVALDLQRLRAELVRRALFPELTAVQA